MSSDSNLPPSTPLDVRLGLTDPKDVSHRLRWGILGAGNISRQWVLSTRACPGSEITAVAARDMDRAKEFAQRLSIPSAYDSYEEMANSPDVDIVYIGTITPLHKAHTLLCIEAGKHVLCEKPLAQNSEDAREMYEAAEKKGVMLQDGMWTRFFPAVDHAKCLIDSGAIGDVRLVQADFFDPIYTIQAAPLGFGKDNQPTKITATGKSSGAAVIEYGDGNCAVLTFPPFNAELAEVTEIIGTKGRLTLGQPGHCPTDLTVRIPPERGVPSRYRTQGAPAPVEHFVYPLPWGVSIPMPFPNQHGFLYQAEALHRCLAAGLRVCPQYDKVDSLHAMDVLTEVTRQRYSTN